MSEYWKSTERYWCKHCACYVRDTKLERANHEATGKHQGALKRFLRDLHRNHEQEERNKERAKQEIDRLNGVVSGQRSGPSAGRLAPSSGGAPSEADVKKQREQLAQLGVEMPDTFRPEMAMPGQWTVTSTTIIEPKTNEEQIDAKASGVKRREMAEEDKEEEEAVRGLFKRSKKWGRDSKVIGGSIDEDLDALLSGTITTKPPKEEEGTVVKHEIVPEAEAENIKTEAEDQQGVVKEEPDDSIQGVDASLKNEADAAEVKKEDSADMETGLPAAEPAAGTVVFKKRKSKNIRQK